MNLDLSVLGWIHSTSCLAALALGPAAFFQRKGGDAHRGYGRAYLIAQLAVNVTAFGIYRRHMFWFPHWFAVAALICIALAYAAVRFKRPRRGWIHVHPTGMLASYYVLIGGGVNEVYLRVQALRAVVIETRGAVIGMTHFAVVLFFVVLILTVNAFVAGRRLGARRAQNHATASA
ncbi:MAG: hypothetical protein ACHP7N_04355 [Caulobacterales bacterium]